MDVDHLTQSIFNAYGLNDDVLSQMARETGFCQRLSGKIRAPALLEHFCKEAIKGTVSYNDLAGKIQTATGVSASRQAYWERMKEATCVAFLKAILARSMLLKFDAQELSLLNSCGLFTRILLQDSTIIQLPARLFETFSGVKNAHAKTCHARIQGVYDLCAGQFISFSIDPYSKNDVSVAADIQVQPGDLLLRDRGYFLIDLLGEFKEKGVDTISRYKHITTLYDLNTQQEINLLDMLTRHGYVDQVYLAGTNKKVRVRLLAVPVKEEIANLRRMKAKKESKGHAPSEELLRLMSWSIFIVTIETPTLTIQHVLALYGLRWRIENIFKTWKSNFSFGKLHNVSTNQLYLLLIARLVIISLCYHRAFVPLYAKIRSRSNRQLSLMKFMRFVSLNMALLPEMLNRHCWTASLLDALARYCTYDKRQRQHFLARLEAIFRDLSDVQTLA
jgi:ribosomal protein S8